VLLIPSGCLTLLVGDDETGKTTLAVDLAAWSTVGAAVTIGGKPTTVRKGTWIWIGLSEDSAEVTLLPRFRAAGGDVDALKVLDTTVDGGQKRLFSLLEDVDALREVIEDTATDEDDVVGIALCPINEFLGDINNWKELQVRQALTPLLTLAEEKDLAVLAIMHPRKQTDGQRVLNMIAGSGAYHWVSRCAWFNKRDTDENAEPHPNRVLMFNEKNSLAPRKATPIAFEFETVDVAPRPGTDDEHVRASRLKFTGSTDKTLREMMTPAEKNGRSSDVAKCMEWLLERLRDGPVAEQIVQEEAQAMGYGRSTYKTARKKLGIKATKSGAGKGDGWQLSLDLGPRSM